MWEKPAIVLLHHGRGVLNGIRSLLVAPGLFENMGREHIANVVRSMRQQTFDGAASRPRVVDAITLDGEPPGLVERILVIAGVGAGALTDFTKKVPGSAASPMRRAR